MSIDDITHDLTESLSISSQLNNINKSHPRFSSYKCKPVCDNQELRRHQLLLAQKRCRDQVLFRLRGLIETNVNQDVTNDCEQISDLNEEEDDSEYDEEQMECSTSSTSSARGRRKRRNKYKLCDKLMLSEWLVEVPLSFASDWYMKVCPVGKRCLIVAERGATKAYAKNGHLINSFPSFLPGGNKRDVKKHKECCILDCIYDGIDRIYYILDLLSWNGSSFLDCQTEFRFFWLQSKLSENTNVKERDSLNPYIFALLSHVSCNHQDMKKEILESKFYKAKKIDGLIFFHKESHYKAGVTPLVCWLKLDMIVDILNLQIDINIDTNV